MAKYRKVDPRIWNDAKFRSLSDHGKLAFFFLLTHPHMTAIGAMRATVPGLAAEIGWALKGFTEAFQEALAKGMTKHDSEACLVWLPNFLKYNRPESPNVVKAWATALELLPECGLKDIVIQNAKAFAEALPEAFLKALPEAFAKSMPNQEQEQEQEQEERLSDPDGSDVGDKSPPPCPHEEIVKLYHAMLPTLPRVREWTKARQSMLTSRWREKPERQSLDWWRKFFGYVAGCAFLTGNVPGRNGGPPFMADLEWLVRPSNFVKVIEGKYEQREAANG